jgi:hypothetical protein
MSDEPRVGDTRRIIGQQNLFSDECLRNLCCDMTTSTLIGQNTINKNFIEAF